MERKTKPDILLLVLDTLRADRLSCYGYPRATTPNIDAFAKSGVLFERAISPAQWTIPAHASIFSGEAPSTHMTVQIYDKHNPHYPTLAQLLKPNGYHSIGLSNNPYLGILENNLERGFDEFYSYSGIFPERLEGHNARSSKFKKLKQHLAHRLNRLSSTLQNTLTKNTLLLRIALHPYIVPLWNRHINLKGNTRQSLRDLVHYLEARAEKEEKKPLFMFVNLMETHLPYGPPARFVRKFAPYYRQEVQTREFMQAYNQQPYRWMIPLAEPLSSKQGSIINDMYAAEVAFEDHLLNPLFEYLNKPAVRANTLVILTSDHGEGLNHHNFVGHSLVAYDDLLHVPLIMRHPQENYPAGMRIAQTTSIQRIFHTILAASGIEPISAPPISEQSLTRAWSKPPQTESAVFAEAYTPQTLIQLMESQDPANIERFRCRAMRRAIYKGPHKLITVDEQADELFNITKDPAELHNLIAQHPEISAELHTELQACVREAKARRVENQTAAQLDLEDDAVVERLRKLGYME